MITEDVLLDIVRQSLWSAVRISAPLLATALITGVLNGLFQALTSIQEKTITFVPKIGLMLAVFCVSLSFMTSTIAHFYTNQVFPLIAQVRLWIMQSTRHFRANLG